MLDDYFTVPEIQRRHRAGLFGTYLDTYTSMAREQGYRPDVVRRLCRLFRRFGRWLERRHLGVSDLNDAVVTEFARRTRRAPRVRRIGASGLWSLVEHLRALGVVRGQAAPARTHAADLAHRYGEYVEQRRALALDTVRRHVSVVQHFLLARFGRRPLRLQALGEKDVTGFVLKTADVGTPRTHQTKMSILRSFFRFLLEQGMIDLDLAAAVQAVSTRRLAGVPKHITRSQVDQLLTSCDQGTPRGRRDFAILLSLARLGLRACEVSRLELDDIRWRTGELVIRGKGSSIEALPLLTDVGRALAAYIKNDRPGCRTRRVFVRMRAPRTALALRGTVTEIVRAAMRRAGLDVPVRGAHVLRHSLATRMLRDGASMSEIGVVLRHRSPATTEIYAKVDIASLKRLAQPWPVEGVR